MRVQVGAGTAARPVGATTLLGVLALLAALLGAHASPSGTAAHHLPGGGASTTGVPAVTALEPDALDRLAAQKSDLSSDLPSSVVDCLMLLGGLAGALLLVTVGRLLGVWRRRAAAPPAGRGRARVPVPRACEPTLAGLCVLRV